MRQAVSFLIVFTKDVLHIIVDLGRGKCDLFLPPRVQRVLNMTSFLSFLLSHSIMTMYPFIGNIAVSTQLNRWSFFANVDGSIRRPHYPWFFCFVLLFLSPILVLCTVECLTLCNAKVMKSH